MCVKNNEFGLKYKLLNHINTLETYFGKDNVKIMVAYDEGKSNDKSLELLKEYNSKNNNVIQIFDMTHINKNISVRTIRIANARNKLLDEIKQKYSMYDYFIFMDTNEYACIGDMNTSVLDYVFENKDKWDSVSFNREAGYYDTWALSFDPFIYSFFHFNDWKFVVNRMRNHWNNILTNSKDGDFINVYSAFNGFAIYKVEKFLNCSFSANIHMDLFPENSIEKNVQYAKRNILQSLEGDVDHRKIFLESIKKNNSKIVVCNKSLFKKVNEDFVKKLRGEA